MNQRLVLIHGMDPRGAKVGGMETHVRQLLRRHPAHMRILMVGIDDFGDLELGRKHVLNVAGREMFSHRERSACRHVPRAHRRRVRET